MPVWLRDQDWEGIIGRVASGMVSASALVIACYGVYFFGRREAGQGMPEAILGAAGAAGLLVLVVAAASSMRAQRVRIDFVLRVLTSVAVVLVSLLSGWGGYAMGTSLPGRVGFAVWMAMMPALAVITARWAFYQRPHGSRRRGNEA